MGLQAVALVIAEVSSSRIGVLTHHCEDTAPPCLPAGLRELSALAEVRVASPVPARSGAVRTIPALAGRS
ncbi:hypothetical protein ABT247_29590 [Kitasatospora sp. NPDC001539]|uniref:hypothetical protein n=1 Tax=Kitasatospora sp. NPDC001539 TaxID=3154384 RepID=UPI00331954F2